MPRESIPRDRFEITNPWDVDNQDQAPSANSSTEGQNVIKRCPACNRVGHLRRSHLDCEMLVPRKSKRNADSDIVFTPVPVISTPAIPVIITAPESAEISIESEENVDTERDVVMEEVDEIVNEEVDEVVTVKPVRRIVVCQHCGREGHQRRSLLNNSSVE